MDLARGTTTESRRSKLKITNTRDTNSFKWQYIILPILKRAFNQILDQSLQPLFPITNEKANGFSLFDQYNNLSSQSNANFVVKNNDELDFMHCGTKY